MQFRQVHLDFHTSEAIPDIGAKFTKAQFQEMLTVGHVSSITLFSKCHHGWAYHPSKANEIHPHLGFDLLGAQIKAAHEIGVRTPVYLSAGLDEKEARRHPEWLIRDREDRTNWVDSFLKPGFHQLCLNSPYLDKLIAQIEEVVQNYPAADGIFLDIVGVRTCLCHTCLNALREAGLDPEYPKAVAALGEQTYARYTRRVREAIDRVRPGLPVFHNGGHLVRGRRDLARMSTHLELESLPTGGWGYDHFPLSARYAATLGMDYLGMTGKFHLSWGEFGGYKHPNALRYEAALSLAMGAKVSVGDQLHPSGRMDPATYALIGTAYAEVAAKEAWCAGAVPLADIALLSLEAATRGSGSEGQTAKVGHSDAGAVRMLLEGHFLFDVVDLDADFGRYKVLVLPDAVRAALPLAEKLADFVLGGGKVLATGTSGLTEDGASFALRLDAKPLGENAFQPDYFRPQFALPGLSFAHAEAGETSFVCYERGQKIEKAEDGRVLGSREDPFFNRTAEHFCSHQHTPGTGIVAGPGMTEGPDGIFIAWPMFAEYAEKGSLFLRGAVAFALSRLLGEARTLETSLPAQGVVTLTEQPEQGRFALHLLYASPVKRGADVEVIEDIAVLRDVAVSVRLPRQITGVSAEPQGQPLPFTQEEGWVSFTVPRLECHQMIVLRYRSSE